MYNVNMNVDETNKDDFLNLLDKAIKPASSSDEKDSNDALDESNETQTRPHNSVDDDLTPSDTSLEQNV